MARAQKIRLREHQRRRKPARADEFLRAVAVGENAVQQRRALDQAGFERAPFVRRDDERNRVELPRAFHAARVAINIVGDALFVDEPSAGVRAAIQFRRPEAPPARRTSSRNAARLGHLPPRTHQTPARSVGSRTASRRGGAAFSAAPASPVRMDCDWNICGWSRLSLLFSASDIAQIQRKRKVAVQSFWRRREFALLVAVPEKS